SGSLREGEIAHLIDQDERRAPILRQELGQAQLLLGHFQLGGERGRGAKEHPRAAQTGGSPQPNEQMRFPQTTRPKEQAILVLRQEGALRELKDLRFGNRGNHGKVKILQPLWVGKLGLAQIALQLVLLALGHLLGKKALQIAQVARSLLLRLPSKRYAVSGHCRQAQLLEIPLHQGDLRVYGRLG